MTLKPRSRFFTADVETAQTLGKMPGNIRYRDTPSVAIGFGQITEQFRCCARKRHFEMERERVFVDSCHADMRTNKER